MMIKPNFQPMTKRLLSILAAATCVAAMSVPANASGYLYATGVITGGCASGSIIVAGVSSSGNNWYVDATAVCTSGATPQTVVKASGSWNPNSGGWLDGAGGGLYIGAVPCGGADKVFVQMQMAGTGAPPISAKATFSRNCA